MLLTTDDFTKYWGESRVFYMSAEIGDMDSSQRQDEKMACLSHHHTHGCWRNTWKNIFPLMVMLILICSFLRLLQWY